MADSDDIMIDQDHLREMIEVISGELELRPLLTTIVQKACELLHADRGSIGLVDPIKNVVRIEAVFRMPDGELGSENKPGVGLAGEVYRDLRPVLVERYGSLTKPKLKGMDDDSVVGMPIMWRGDVIGTFGIGAGPPKRFGDNDLRMLEVFARHAAIAINNARSYEREKHYAALKERQRLARDLHDNVSQLIFSMTLIGQSIGAGYEQTREEGDARVARMMEIARLAQKEMKVLLAELSAPADERGSLAAYATRNGLKKALQRHCKLTIPDGVEIDIEIPENVKLTDLQTEALLRIAQEALANALRHGAAHNIRINLREIGRDLLFCIEDDGVGFSDNEEQENSGKHYGLSNMKSRANKIGAQFSVNNAAIGGVRIEVTLSLS